MILNKLTDMLENLIMNTIWFFKKDYPKEGGEEQNQLEFVESGDYSEKPIAPIWEKNNDMPKYTGDGKKCPFCKGNHVLTFRYGYRANPPTEEELKIYAFGGCCIDAGSPKYYCDDCKKRFGRVR